LIDSENKEISIFRQCELVGLSRASFYYQARLQSDENVNLMRLLDEQYTRCPFYGVKRMTAWLKSQGHGVNEKRVRRLLREMGLEAQYPKPKMSQARIENRIYQYLLRGVLIEKVNQVWSTDITYIRLAQGFVYLVAVIDWHSRYVLSWELSVTMESEFCVIALENALEKGRPEIFNTDQGSQFTSEIFTSKLLAQKIRISMDGRGRALDNIFVERLWRSVKYEEVYLNEYKNVSQAREGLRNYFEFYNRQRLHQSLNYQTPEAVYRQGLKQAALTTLI
jgi:putative transposase